MAAGMKMAVVYVVVLLCRRFSDVYCLRHQDDEQAAFIALLMKADYTAQQLRRR
jgi:hypothetical protein